MHPYSSFSFLFFHDVSLFHSFLDLINMRKSQFDPVLLRLDGTNQLRVSESVVAIHGNPDSKML